MITSSRTESVSRGQAIQNQEPSKEFNFPLHLCFPDCIKLGLHDGSRELGIVGRGSGVVVIASPSPVNLTWLVRESDLVDLMP